MQKLISGLILSIISFGSFAQTPAMDSLSIKIGQMLMVGFSGTQLATDDPIIDEIREGRVGGIIYFEKNIAKTNSYDSMAQLSAQLQALAPIPLIIAIDQEGGKVNRLKTKYGFPESRTAGYLGVLDNPDSTRYYAKATAKTLKKLGINVNFAPVLDLATNPDNPIIAKYERSFSADPEVVVKHASIFIEEHTKQGIATVGKHFPGHGSSKDDTHLGMADVTETWSQEELLPYQDLARNNFLPGVMSAHIVNSKLDTAGLPGTLSRKILQGILREQVGFQGVVFSDDMQMHAITKHYGLEKAIELGINAGLDVIIFSNNITGSKERAASVVHQLMRQMVEDGRIPVKRINESYTRIMRLKKKYCYE